jgi:asparagine synthase (glutamine-hydrolysing)
LKGSIELYFRDSWNHEEGTFAKGSAFVEGELLEKQKLAEYFNKSTSEDAINIANGFWGLVKKRDNSMLIVADRIRSYPLFYGVLNNIAYVSDDAYWVKEKTGDKEFEVISKNEFLLTGYVTGCDTLYKNVKQIQAGEIVFIDFDKEDNIEVTSWKYYNFIHEDYFENLSRQQLLQEQESSLLKAINRLIEYASGRTIVIPLSGGYDSRLVATTLKKLNYNKVITFTFGKINNPESLISKEVARNLNFEWIFIPYDNEKSYEWYNSIEKKNFSTYGDNLSTILPDREWPAVRELKKQNLIPKDAVFVPGHSGDFISGGHIPQKLCKENVTEEQFVQEILKKHYVMWNWNGVKDKWISDFSNKILNCAEMNLFDEKNNAANSYEKWNWRENEIKRMVNSVKIYDFFGYEYWLPLWDYEYMNFWCKVPLNYRINKNLYDEYVVNLYSQTANITIDEAQKRDPPLDTNSILKKIFNKVFNKLSVLLTKEKYQMRKEEAWDMDWEQSAGRLTKEIYDKLLPYVVGRGSCTTLERLGYIDYRSKDVPKATLDMLKSLKGEKVL